MASRHLSLRIPESVHDQLEAESRRNRETLSDLARRLIEEGLRMEAHPGIVFRSGPAGRRAGLSGGPDIWEVARVFRGKEMSVQSALDEAIELTGLSRWLLETALGYYAAYTEEIDDWMDSNDREADRAYDAWLKQQQLLKQ